MFSHKEPEGGVTPPPDPVPGSNPDVEDGEPPEDNGALAPQEGQPMNGQPMEGQPQDGQPGGQVPGGQAPGERPHNPEERHLPLMVRVHRG